MLEMDANESKGAEATSIEDVTMKLDALSLSIFEAVRGHQFAPILKADSCPVLREFIENKAKDIIKAHSETVAAVENLAGIDKTKRDQEEIISQLSQELTARKRNIISLEKQLIFIADKIDAELDELLPDVIQPVKRLGGGGGGGE